MTAAITDVLVVGGGPVGLSAAIEARLAGLSVTVIEPRETPIDKACGEGLMPGALPLLARLGVSPQGMPLGGIGYFAEGRQVLHRFAGGPGLGVHRPVLQAALAERARELGVLPVRGRVVGLLPEPQSVTAVLADGTTHTARWLLGCDGLHSTVARLAGLELPGAVGGGRYGIRRHYATEPWSDFVEVHYGPQAEVYVTPVGPKLVGVAVLGPRGVSYADALAAVAAVAQPLEGVTAVDEPRGAGPFRRRTRARHRGRVLLVGDASGYVDALTGEGLRLGFAQARAAIECLGANDPGRYEREWRRITRDFRLLTRGLVAWAESPLRGSLVAAAVRAPKLFGAVVERLAR